MALLNDKRLYLPGNSSASALPLRETFALVVNYYRRECDSTRICATFRWLRGMTIIGLLRFQIFFVVFGKRTFYRTRYASIFDYVYNEKETTCTIRSYSIYRKGSRKVPVLYEIFLLPVEIKIYRNRI